MSLHTLAHHLQSAGRGEDKVLVHMTPGEVKGLQSLAMAHGGSLTINPETGLPEAGFLKSLLPTLAGLGLSFIPGVGPMMAASIVGGGTAVATGSLTKGLMAGLGAYSGAGMGAGLKAMATPAVAPAVSGLSPTVAANASTLGGTSPLANVGAENLLTTTDDLLMQGAKSAPVGGFNPSDSVVFVKNAPVPAVTPANAADFMNQTNQSILGKLPNAGNLPVAAGGPRPFPADFPTGNSTIPLDVKPVRADTYFDSNYAPGAPNISGTSGGVPKGFSAQRGTPITQQVYGGPDVKPDYSYVERTFQRPNASKIATANAKVAQGPVELTYDGIPYKYGDGRQSISFGEGHTLLREPVRQGPIDLTYDDIVYKSGDGRQSISFGENHTLLKDPRVPTVDKSRIQAPIGRPAGRIDVLPGDPPLAQPRSLSAPFREHVATMGRGAEASFGSLEGLKGLYAATEAAAPYATYAGLGSTAYSMYDEKRQQMEDEARARAEANRGLIRPYTFSYGTGNVSSQPYYGSAERTYFQPTYTELPSYKAPGPEYAAKGGLMSLAVGGPVEEMAAMNSVGANTGYPMASLQTPVYSNPAMQRPEAMNVIAPSADYGVSAYSGEPRFAVGGPTTQEGSGSVTAFGRGSVSPNSQSSGYTYDYNPNTMQFTQTGGPGFSKTPTGEELAQGVAAHDMLKRFNEHILTGNPYNSTPSFMAGTAPNGTVSGGIATPIMQPAAPAQSFIPNINIPAYQTPEQQLGLGGFYDYMNQQMGGYGGYAAGGGVSHLGGYSDGGRLLKGPGDGVSDSIPASIGNRQPARLADGEFVVPARIVSEIGNGSTDAGARKLYAMMDRIQKARSKTVGKRQVAKDTKAENLLPA